jgi:hypothetical protein
MESGLTGSEKRSTPVKTACFPAASAVTKICFLEKKSKDIRGNRREAFRSIGHKMILLFLLTYPTIYVGITYYIQNKGYP